MIQGNAMAPIIILTRGADVVPEDGKIPSRPSLRNNTSCPRLEPNEILHMEATSIRSNVVILATLSTLPTLC